MSSYNLLITDKDILELIFSYPEDKREAIVLKALKIGLIALKDAQMIGNVDYVKNEFLKFKTDIEKEFLILKQEFAEKLRETDEVIKKELDNKFDPQTGVLNQVLEKYLGEGGKLSDLFDEEKSSSAIGRIKQIFADYFDTDASKIVRLLDPNNPESPLSSLKKDLIERLFNLEKEIKAIGAAKQAIKEEAEKGTQKGFEYEQLVFQQVEKISSILGDNCFLVGNEQGMIFNSKTGDIVVNLNPSQTGGANLKIVFECKDKEMSLQKFLEELDEAKKNRGALLAVGIISRKDLLKGVNGAIGVFREYPNDKSICLFDKEILDPTALEIAYKLARTRLLLGLKVKEMKSDSVDVEGIKILIEEISRKLNEFSSIKSTLTKATTAIDEAKTNLDKIKDELQEKLDELLQKVKKS